VPIVADWATISALATAGGTLVLAVATFASVRSANRSALVSERALLATIRPVLVNSRLDDPPEKVGFADDHWMKLEGGHAVVDLTDDAVYLAIGLRNVGNGIAVLDRWDFHPERLVGDDAHHRDPSTFRRLTRDLYVPAGSTGFWQGAFRDPEDPAFVAARDALSEGRSVTVDLLYGDHDGGQHAVARFALVPTPDRGWLAIIGRHWNLDRDDPR
jgi:hypothetical protein